MDLLLEALSKDLTVVNVQWVPGSQTLLAVGTRDFVKIYDMAEDNICPTHNFMIFSGFISDFSFGSYQIQNGNQAKSAIYVSSKGGSVYFQEFSYRTSKDRQSKDE